MSQYAATEYAESMRAFQQYAVRMGKQGYSPEIVGRFIHKVFETQNPKTRYAIVPNPISNWVLPLLFPDRWLDKLIGRNVGLLPKS